MRMTEVAGFYPGRCAVIPYVGSHNAGWFIDTENEVDGARIYISDIAMAEMIRVAGLFPPSIPDVRPELEAANARVEQLEAENAALKSQMDAIAVLKSAGYRGERQPGRPPKKKVNA